MGNRGLPEPHVSSYGSLHAPPSARAADSAPGQVNPESGAESGLAGLQHALSQPLCRVQAELLPSLLESQPWDNPVFPPCGNVSLHPPGALTLSLVPFLAQISLCPEDLSGPTWGLETSLAHPRMSSQKTPFLNSAFCRTGPRRVSRVGAITQA